MLKYSLAALASFAVLVLDPGTVPRISEALTRTISKCHDALTDEARPKLVVDQFVNRDRDFAALRAVFQDLLSPNNPEYKYLLQNGGPGTMVVANDMTKELDRLTNMLHDLSVVSRNIDGEDPRRIPVDIQEDFKRRMKEPAWSLLALGKSSIVIRDGNEMLEHLHRAQRSFWQEYPEAWDCVWVYPPAYSDDGKSAVVVLDSLNGPHGADWVYMLVKWRDRWLVSWRHLRIYF